MKRSFITKYLKKSDGTQIFFRFWKGKKNSPALILLHGLGAHSLRFEEMAEFFRKRSFNVYAFDFSGFGKSQAYKGHIDKFETYLNETLAMLKLAETELPDVPKFIVGESMGGVVGIHFAKYYQDYFDGLILLSPAILCNIKIPLQKKIEAGFNTLFNKFHTYDVPFTNEMLTRDYKWQKKLQSDELDIKVVTGRFYFVLNSAMKECFKIAKKLELPILVLQGEDDSIGNTNGVVNFFNKIGSQEKQLQVLKGFYHALSIDKNREIVYNIIFQWINQRIYLIEEFEKTEE